MQEEEKRIRERAEKKKRMSGGGRGASGDAGGDAGEVRVAVCNSGMRGAGCRETGRQAIVYRTGWGGRAKEREARDVWQR
jgi:hypothetical protein